MKWLKELDPDYPYSDYAYMDLHTRYQQAEDRAAPFLDEGEDFPEFYYSQPGLTPEDVVAKWERIARIRRRALDHAEARCKAIGSSLPKWKQAVRKAVYRWRQRRDPNYGF